MSRTFHHGKRSIRVRTRHRENPDLRRMARAMIDFARAQAEAEAQAGGPKKVDGSRTSTTEKRPRGTGRKGGAA